MTVKNKFNFFRSHIAKKSNYPVHDFVSFEAILDKQ